MTVTAQAVALQVPRSSVLTNLVVVQLLVNPLTSTVAIWVQL